MHLGIEYTEKYLENGEKRPFFGNESISPPAQGMFFWRLEEWDDSSRRLPQKYQCCGDPNRKQSKSIKQSDTFTFVESVHQFVDPKMLDFFCPSTSCLGSSGSLALPQGLSLWSTKLTSCRGLRKTHGRWDGQKPRKAEWMRGVGWFSWQFGGSVHGENSGMSCNVPICLGILKWSNWYGWLKLRLFQYEVISSIHHGFCPLLLLMEKYDSYICLPLSKSWSRSNWKKGPWLFRVRDSTYIGIYKGL